MKNILLVQNVLMHIADELVRQIDKAQKPYTLTKAEIKILGAIWVLNDSLNTLSKDDAALAEEVDVIIDEWITNSLSR